MFKTRKECVDFLISKGCVEALAKVAINECFNQIPQPAETDEDLCRICTGPDSVELVVVPEETALEAYYEIVDNDLETKHDGIYILGELSYTLDGDVIVKQPETSAPEGETLH